MSNSRFTFADAKQKIADLEDQVRKGIELLDAQKDNISKRVSKRDYYQGAALGAIITAILFIIGIVIA